MYVSGKKITNWSFLPENIWLDSLYCCWWNTGQHEDESIGECWRMEEFEVQFIREKTETEWHEGLSIFQGSNGSAQGTRSAKAKTVEHCPGIPMNVGELLWFSLMRMGDN